MEGGNEVIVVVRPGSAGSYVYRRTACRRVGRTTLAMSDEVYNGVLFERMHAERRWEMEPSAGWLVDAPMDSKTKNEAGEKSFEVIKWPARPAPRIYEEAEPHLAKRQPPPTTAPRRRFRAPPWRSGARSR